MPGAKRWSYCAALIALAGLAFFIGIGAIGLAGPDEPRYAEVAREMFASGDYISPRLCGCLWFEKPPLLYWLAAVAYHAFGVGEFAARAPSALAAAGGALFLFHAVTKTVSVRLGAAVSLVLMTMAIFIGYGRAATPDMLLTASITISLCAAHIAGGVTARARVGYLVISGAAAGMAVLSKGLVGILLIGAVLAVAWLITRRWVFRPGDIILTAVVFLAVCSSWYLPVTMRHGWEFVREFFINHHVKRYLTNEYHHPEPIYFYLAVALAGALPWTLYLASAIGRLRKLRFRGANARDYLLALAWIWFLIPILFFSFSVSKLPGYILPSFPALSLIVGNEIERFLNGERSAVMTVCAWLTSALLLVLAAAFLIYLHRELGSGALAPELLRLAPLVIAAGSMFFLLRNSRRQFIASSAAFTISIVLVSIALLPPRLSSKISLRDLSVKTAASLRAGERIAFYLDKEYAPVFYAEGRVVCGVGEGDVLNAYSPEEIVDAVAREGSVVVITYIRKAGDLESDARLSTEPIAVQGSEMAMRVGASKPVR